jgi:quercetin 2,3-dioxygenase
MEGHKNENRFEIAGTLRVTAKLISGKILSKSLLSRRGRHLSALTAAILTATTATTKAFSSSSTSDQVCKAMSPLAIKVIPDDKLFVSEPDPRWFGNGANEEYNPVWTNSNWLKSRFHFSFAEYSNHQNSNFGVLRVMNDDLVQPKRGFGTHPHGDMEIITYIVHGELTHKDSMGTEESLGRGSIQFMTAGTGIRHSEFNNGDKPLRFIQTWIVPSERGLKPNYGSCRGNPEKDKNALQHLVSNVKDMSTSTPVEINQDVDAFASELEMGKSVVHEMPPGRQGYLLCMEGSVSVNGHLLTRCDACEITNGAGTLEIKAEGTEPTENGEVAHFLLFTMKAVPGSGRNDF